MLWIGLAGGVRVEVDGVSVDDGLLGGRQGRRLLARLAWEGRAVHRDELADGIWLESLPRTWERTLSGVVTLFGPGSARRASAATSSRSSTAAIHLLAAVMFTSTCETRVRSRGGA